MSKDQPPKSDDLAELVRLQNELEAALLDNLGTFIKDHPVADPAQFTLNALLSVAARVGTSNLGAERTAYCMEVVANTVRIHAGRKPEAH